MAFAGMTYDEILPPPTTVVGRQDDTTQKIMLIQIIISLFALFAILNLFGKKKKRPMKWAEFLSWLLFWAAAIVAVWIPNFLTKLANFFGIGRGADLVLYVGLVAVFYFIFRIYVRIEKMESNITKIVRDEALDDKP
jgi:small membrane protein